MMAGYTVATYAGLGFYFAPVSDNWRGSMGLSMAWPFLVLCGIYWVPESPRFLIAKGRKNEAWEIIRKTHADSIRDPTDEYGKREFYQIQKQIEVDTTLENTYWEILKRPSFRRRVWMTIFLEFAIMSSGILVILSKCIHFCAFAAT